MINLIVINAKKHKKEEDIALKLLRKIPPQLWMLWGIESSGNIQMYLSKSHIFFMLKSLPVYKALLLIFTFPLWYIKSKQNLKLSTGMICEREGKHFVLLAPANSNKTEFSSLENKLFYRFRCPYLTFERNACNILLGVFVSSVMLPYWLKNGLVIFCSDEVLGVKFLKTTSLTLLKGGTYKEIVDYFSENVGKEEFAYNYVKGYWTVRYLEEENPVFLKKTFKSYKGTDVVRVIGKKLGIDTTDNEKMWGQLDEFLYNHFEHLLETE